MKQAIQNFFKYRFLLKELVKKGVKLKYRRSYLGIIWTLLEPLLTMIVLTVVFGTLFGNTDKTFPVYILSGRLLFSFFSQATTGALKSIESNSAMIKKVYVPKYLYPLANVLFNFVIFLLSLIVLVAVSAVVGIKPTWHLVSAVIPLVTILLFSFGVGMVLSTVGVYFKDMEYLWSVATMLFMYSCAIFYYPDTILRSRYGWILKYNPLYRIIECFRNAIFGHPINIKAAVYALGVSIVAIIAGMIIFKKKQDNFILHI